MKETWGSYVNCLIMAENVLNDTWYGCSTFIVDDIFAYNSLMYNICLNCLEYAVTL